MTPEQEGDEEGDKPKRQRVDQVPLGIRKPRSPKFDSRKFADDQIRRDRESEKDLLRKAGEADLESPDLHQDYNIKDGDELDRHLEGISSVNAIKELIAQVIEELEEELAISTKPFSIGRMDRLMVFTKEAITGYGEEQGYIELKKRLRDLIMEDHRFAQEEMDRKKDAYLRSSGK